MPEYGRMTTLDAAATVHIHLMIAVVVWAVAIGVVLVCGEQNSVEE